MTTVTHIENIEDAASEALHVYANLKETGKKKGENLLEKAVGILYTLWGKNAGYEEKLFREIIFSKINKWKKEKKERAKKLLPLGKLVQGTLF